MRRKGASQRRSARPWWRRVRGPRASAGLQTSPPARLQVGREGPAASEPQRAGPRLRCRSTPTPDCSARENGRAERQAPPQRRGRGLGLSEGPVGAGASCPQARRGEIRRTRAVGPAVRAGRAELTLCRSSLYISLLCSLPAPRPQTFIQWRVLLTVGFVDHLGPHCTGRSWGNWIWVGCPLHLPPLDF